MKPEKSCLPRLANFKTRWCGEWKEKFSAPPVAKTTVPGLLRQKKFWKIPVQRVAGGLWNVSLAERKKGRPQRAASPVLSVLCTEEPDRGSLRQLQSKFLPRCQNPQFCGFAPRGKLVGECLPQTLLYALTGEKAENSFCYFPKSCPMGGIEGFFCRNAKKSFCNFPKS